MSAIIVVAWTVLVFSVCSKAAAASTSSWPASGPSSPPRPQGQQPPQASKEPGGFATYLGDKVCESCHQAAAHSFSQTMMGKIMLAHPRDEVEGHGCESCHGPGSKYVQAMAAAMGRNEKPDEILHGPSSGGLMSFRADSGESANRQNAICLNCHKKGDQAFWRASEHAFRGVRCTDCHLIMRKLSPEFQLASAMESNPFIITRPETQVCLNCHLKQKMQINMPSHMPIREGLMTCTDCHNPHGGPYPKMLKEATVNETCYFCHAEKRGPWLWMHPPVAQDCLNCHDPHGSIERFMLTMRPPRLCQQCHIAEHAGSPYGPGAYYVFSRSCLNCHFHVHGSNSPGGWALTR